MHRITKLGMFALAVLWVVVALAAMVQFPVAPIAHKPTTPRYCVLARTPETDGVPVTCLNTGKIATEADYRHVCFTDGYGIELFSVNQGQFIKTSCDAMIPTLPAYAQYWQAIVFTTDGQIDTVAAWSGDNYVIVSGDSANTHAGTDASMVAYLQNIEAMILRAKLARS